MWVYSTRNERGGFDGAPRRQMAASRRTVRYATMLMCKDNNLNSSQSLRDLQCSLCSRSLSVYSAWPVLYTYTYVQAFGDQKKMSRIAKIQNVRIYKRELRDSGNTRMFTKNQNVHESMHFVRAKRCPQKLWKSIIIVIIIMKKCTLIK